MHTCILHVQRHCTAKAERPQHWNYNHGNIIIPNETVVYSSKLQVMNLHTYMYSM